ncbi:HNH endonuclease [Microbacterium sp. 4-7]|uniref:HNH endonuclease n=1 Tax=Microbacterium sp. 4-7 TaxID=1885327 RepID=UPI00164FD94E|nr:HNH endonuclease [Microbacterium sp. 4-7]
MVNWLYDEVVLAADLVASNDWKGLRTRDPGVLDLSFTLRRFATILHPGVSLSTSSRSQNSVHRKTYDIATADEFYAGKRTRHSKLDALVVRQFRDDPDAMHSKAVAIKSVLWSVHLPKLLPPKPIDDFDEESVREGGILERIVRARERSRVIRNRKIAAVAATGRPIECEACGFDFAATYGERGAGYIEVHHILPLHISGETETSLEDLSLLCSNCHRMCHRGGWMTPKAVAALVATTERATLGSARSNWGL